MYTRIHTCSYTHIICIHNTSAKAKAEAKTTGAEEKIKKEVQGKLVVSFVDCKGFGIVNFAPLL